MIRPYRVELVKSAKKEFDQLPAKIQDKVLEALAVISANPFSELLRIKKLKGAPSLYRILRLGDYRIVYEVNQATFSILVIKIGHRQDVYGGL